MPDARLVALQTSASDWHARRARVILQHRAFNRTLQTDTHDRLRELFRTSTNADWRLRAMWGLHVTGGWSSSTLAETLADRDEYVRAWAVQLLTEDRAPSNETLDRFARMARDDRSAVVRLYLAAALQRIGEDARWPIASALMAHAEDANDHNLPKMIWLAVEPLVASNPTRALEHASSSRIPLLARFIARRTSDADLLEPVVTAIGKAPATRQALLEGLRDGMEGRFDLDAPPNWPAVLRQLRRSPAPVARLAADIAQQFGDTETARRNIAAVRSASASADERRRALQMLAAQRRPQLVQHLPVLLDDEKLRVDAIRAIAAFDEEPLASALIERYPALGVAERTEAIQTLASRRSYGRLLTAAIASNTIPRRDIPVHVARQLLRVVGAGFTEVWGPVEQSVAEDKTYARYRRLLTETAIRNASVQNGRATFQRTCGACHKLYGEGGAIGPDLTGSNRGNLDYLLLNVLDPNAEVPDGYKMVLVNTRDGRTFSGTVVTETDRQITLRVVGRDAPVAIRKADVQTREVAAASMMPPGLFDALADREVIDLVAYLRTVEPPKATGSARRVTARGQSH
jgi:putative heme-binding domain-containing protein